MPASSPWWCRLTGTRARSGPSAAVMGLDPAAQRAGDDRQHRVVERRPRERLRRVVQLAQRDRGEGHAAGACRFCRRTGSDRRRARTRAARTRRGARAARRRPCGACRAGAPGGAESHSIASARRIAGLRRRPARGGSATPSPRRLRPAPRRRSATAAASGPGAARTARATTAGRSAPAGRRRPRLVGDVEALVRHPRRLGRGAAQPQVSIGGSAARLWTRAAPRRWARPAEHHDLAGVARDRRALQREDVAVLTAERDRGAHAGTPRPRC